MARQNPTIGDLVAQKYNTVAASQTDQALTGGGGGAAGDFLGGLLIVPSTTTTPGNVSIKDGAGSAIVVCNGTTLQNTVPISVVLGIKSTAGAWKVTTGAGYTVVAYGRFT